MGKHALRSGPRAETGSYFRRDLGWQLGLLAFLCGLLALWAWMGDERIPTSGGAGFDGSVYWKMVQDPSLILNQGLDLHRVQRIVPSLTVWALLAPLGKNTDLTWVLGAFHLVDVLLMLGCVVLWWRMARRLALSQAALWIGQIALFTNYAQLKVTSFYPNLTDRFGFALGVLVLWLVIERRRVWLPVTAIVGAFTWPTVGYSAWFLYVAARSSGSPGESGALVARPRVWWGIAVSALAAVLVALLSIKAHGCQSECVSNSLVRSTIEILYPVSVLLAAAWVFLALHPLAARLTPGQLVGSLVWWRIPLALGAVLMIGRLQVALSDDSKDTLGRTLNNTMLGSSVKPLGFLVVHASYFGPAVLLLMLTWRVAVRRLAQLGPGVVAVMIVFILLGVSTESRILVNQWPFFALAAALVVDELRWSPRAAWVFAAIALVTSRIWLPINHGPITMHWWQYPGQWYFMSNGPTTTTASYLMLAAGMVGTGIAVWALIRSQASRPAAGRSAPS